MCFVSYFKNGRLLLQPFVVSALPKFCLIFKFPHITMHIWAASIALTCNGIQLPHGWLSHGCLSPTLYAVQYLDISKQIMNPF